MSWGCFLEHLRRTRKSDKRPRLTAFVTTSRPWTINQVPIDYGFRPRLRGRLTLRGLTLRRNPWTFGESVSHTLCRYSCQHSHFRYLQGPSRDPFAGLRNAPLPLRGQTTEDREQNAYRRGRIRPCSILAIAWYSLRQAFHVASST